MSFGVVLFCWQVVKPVQGQQYKNVFSALLVFVDDNRVVVIQLQCFSMFKLFANSNLGKQLILDLRMCIKL